MQRRLRRDLGWGAALAAGIVAAAASAPAPARACGGFFCSSANPVNQAAEQIVFADNGDGTVTAIIQIMYEGPSNKFAWVLPVPGNPQVEVSSDQALDALKQATNPLYQLTVSFDPSCSSGGFPQSAGAAGAGGSASGPTLGNPGVTVQASGAIGPYLYDVISVDPMLADPADAAIVWLGDNAYDVGEIGPEVLRPYLAEGLNLIAFKLQKGNSSGSIRPVMITYESALPSIPIRPTAVAANDDMGVLVWVLSGSRAIPENYKALELNEALIDWFNPNNNYNEVVSRAADEAQGQGFVTEYAGTMASLGIQVFPDWQQQMWDSFMVQQHTDPVEMIQSASANWGGWDGFQEAIDAATTLPATISPEDFRRCLRCYIDQPGVMFDTSVFLTQLYELVIKPMIETQDLLDSRPYLTRLYTTMSADEMTLDPVFDFNPDLDDVSNFHSATRVLECPAGGTGDPFSGPWRVELPNGVVRGTEPNVWPIAIDEQPAAAKIIEFGTQGQGVVVEDRTREIAMMLGRPTATPAGGTGGSAPRGGSGGGGTSGSSGLPRAGAGGSTGSRDAGTSEEPAPGPTARHDDGGCSAAAGRPADALPLLLLSFAALLRRRRRAA